MKNEIIVSICCNTYNHENYISQAIEGFLMQKTTFPYEIIIHNDASTDKTAEIIRDYEKKNRDLIKPIYQSENQFSKGIGISINYTWPKARGKYIALCEGDDYWTDPYKLQKQVDFLEENPDCSLYFHAAEHLWMDSGRKTIYRHPCTSGSKVFKTKDVILGGGGIIPTPSMVFRSEYVVNLPIWLLKAPAGDYAISLLLASKGKVAYLDRVMCVYRKGAPGSWSIRNNTFQKLKIHSQMTEKMLLEFNKYCNFVHSKSVFIKIVLNRLRLVKKFLCGRW